MSVFLAFTTALPPKADVKRDGRLRLLLTLSGHHRSDRLSVIEINWLSDPCILAVNSDSEFDVLALVWRMAKDPVNFNDV
jgi:hypothetical protein